MVLPEYETVRKSRDFMGGPADDRNDPSWAKKTQEGLIFDHAP
jgi:hypothetical protein